MEFYYNFANVKCIVSSWGTYKNTHFAISFPFLFKQLQADSKSVSLGEYHISIKNFIQIKKRILCR